MNEEYEDVSISYAEWRETLRKLDAQQERIEDLEKSLVRLLEILSSADDYDDVRLLARRRFPVDSYA